MFPCYWGLSLVSVICVTHDRPVYFEQAVKSYERQTYKDKELIVLKSGCTVDYPYMPKDAVVIEAQDVFGDITPAICKTSGNIITVLHDDDMFYDENSLANRIKPFENPDVEVTFTSWVTMDKDGKKTSGVMDCGNVSLKSLLMKEYIYFPTMSFRLSVLDKFNYIDNELRAYSDYIFKVRFLFDCNCMPVHEPTLLYRQHSGQESLICASNGVNKKEKILFRDKAKNIIGCYL